jgi:hypothetical protein
MIIVNTISQVINTSANFAFLCISQQVLHIPSSRIAALCGHLISMPLNAVQRMSIVNSKRCRTMNRYPNTLTGLLLVAATAYAAPSVSAELEEIIVTAQKREESLLDASSCGPA